MKRSGGPAREKIPEAQEAPAFFSAQVAHSHRFYFDLNPPKGRLIVLCGGLEKCAPNYTIERQSGFPFLCLEYVANGAGTLVMNGVAHELTAGRVFAYGPGVSLEMAASPANPMAKYFVCFTGTQSSGLLGSAGLAPGGIVDIFPPYALAALFEEIIEAGALGGQRGQNLCAALVNALMLKLAAAVAPGARTRSDAFNTFRRCRKHIEQRYLDLASLAQAAEECRVDASYLCRLFQTYDHQSPYQFLMRLKMHHAATDLQRPEVTVKQAALAVGFSDQLHFSRVFRKVLGVSPTALKGIR
jgi:AraC-like DNA-binding protein